MPPTDNPRFVTPESTLGWCLACFVGSVVAQFVVPTPPAVPGTGAPAVIGALSEAVVVVSVLVAWPSGILLALRAHSIRLALIAALPFPPLTSMIVAYVLRNRARLTPPPAGGAR